MKEQFCKKKVNENDSLAAFLGEKPQEKLEVNKKFMLESHVVTRDDVGLRWTINLSGDRVHELGYVDTLKIIALGQPGEDISTAISA